MLGEQYEKNTSLCPAAADRVWSVLCENAYGLLQAENSYVQIKK